MPPDESISSESAETPEVESEDGLIQLSFNEARVLGCLLEKEATTPDQYPLTLNALHSACNQSSNRNPVVDLGTDEVEEAMEGLRYKKLAILVHQAGARVAKNKHTLENLFPYLTVGERAILCVLLLRGQQTAGELRQRTERMHAFRDIDSTQAALDKLAACEPDPLVKMIPAGGGRRVVTYIHRFCGDVGEDMAITAVHPAVAESVAGPTWREEMATQIAGLRSELEELRDEFKAFREELGG